MRCLGKRNADELEQGRACMGAAAVNRNPLNICERISDLLLKLRSRYCSMVAFSWVCSVKFVYVLS